jgi:hypothetical protein
MQSGAFQGSAHNPGGSSGQLRSRSAALRYCRRTKGLSIALNGKSNMRYVRILLVTLLVLPAICEAAGRTYVGGYVRKDGTYVPPHYRTTPDASFYNNWSTLGNINPYTGKPGTKIRPNDSSDLSFRPSTVPGFTFAPVPPALEQPASPSAVIPRPPLEGSSSATLPDAIAEGILSLARKQWPKDLSMQAYTVRKQREGYAALENHLRAYNNAGLPREIRDWALTKAQNEWPNDYSMQAYSYEKNLDGYLRTSALISSDEWKSLPQNHAQWMLETAYKQWRDDFSMQAYALEKQINGYYELANLEKRLRGLPLDVADGIRGKARSSWPNDLSMQAYLVRKELKGYLELQGLLQ